jgi:dTDP-4-dehydrorhamnose 3,5-epimerase/CDP-3, 6-dideoxy-D-glycero-D-glycero-4-hexulose-5-epimerase
MNSQKTDIPGLLILTPFVHKDERGAFVKTFHKEQYENLGLNSLIQESFYTVSNKNVLRGMHFQLPPHDLDKIVYVTKGRVLDVVLDLRKESPTYRKSFSIELSYENNLQLYIPKGCAHGFLCLEDDSFINYFQSSMYHPDSDVGIKYDSFNFDWPVDKPIMSHRDESFLTLDEFKSPFTKV